MLYMYSSCVQWRCLGNGVLYLAHLCHGYVLMPVCKTRPSLREQIVTRSGYINFCLLTHQICTLFGFVKCLDAQNILEILLLHKHDLYQEHRTIPVSLLSVVVNGYRHQTFVWHMPCVRLGT